MTDTNVSPFARACNICCGHKFCVQGTKIVSDFVQKHFVSATNVSQFAQPKKHHGQQCVRNNVSSFASALSAGPCDGEGSNCLFENSLGEIVIEVLKETHPCTKSSRYGE